MIIWEPTIDFLRNSDFNRRVTMTAFQAQV